MSNKLDKSYRTSEIHDYGIDIEQRVLFLQNKEDSGENSGVDHRMAQQFLRNIKILESHSEEPIVIYMQSIGGCWYSGMGIYDAIKNSTCKTVLVAYNQIESMSSIILQAADKRVVMPNCWFMCHYGSSFISGDYLSSQNWAKVDKVNCDTMVEIYAAKCIKGQYFKDREYSLSQVKSYLKRKMKDGDWYLNPSEAVSYGFADNVFSKLLKI
ncbi:ATP-dependent Clp protease proteolytic subunit [bacterium]|nr:ATP-dependent Clp protease proteolytic subunit [bacterium]